MKFYQIKIGSKLIWQKIPQTQSKILKDDKTESYFAYNKSNTKYNFYFSCNISKEADLILF